jgi:hypothetical protein
VREREDFAASPRAGTVNIPVLELTTRATYELDRASLIVFDCSNLDQPTCNFVDRELTKRGYRTQVLESGVYFRSCAATVTVAKR